MSKIYIRNGDGGVIGFWVDSYQGHGCARSISVNFQIFNIENYQKGLNILLLICMDTH